MDNLIGINLRKALRLKNCIAGQITKVTKDIAANNSVLTENANLVDIPTLITKRTQLVEAMITVKTAIAEANQEIQPLIFKIGEHKATLKMFNELNTSEGMVNSHFSEEPQEYKAAINLEAKNKQIFELEKHINTIQTELDAFNANKLIRISDKILELVPM